MGQAQINVRTRACSGTSIARTKQAALTHNVRGKRLNTIYRPWGKSLLSAGHVSGCTLGLEVDLLVLSPTLNFASCLLQSVYT